MLVLMDPSTRLRLAQGDRASSTQNNKNLAHSTSLNFEPVDRLPLMMCYPLPEDGQFKSFPHSQVFDDPEMLYNELVHAFDTSIAHHNLINDDLPCTVRAYFDAGRQFGNYSKLRAI